MNQKYRPCAAALALACALAAPAFAKQPEPLKLDAASHTLIRPAEFQEMVLSPNGQLLAIAQRGDKGTMVTINRVSDFKAIRMIQAGVDGSSIDTIRWVDDERVLVGTTSTLWLFGWAIPMPSLYMVPVAEGKHAEEMPANFLASIEGDKEHLLVYRCPEPKKRKDDCVVEIRKVAVNALSGDGELLVTAPDGKSVPLSDDHGHVRFALGYSDDGTSKAWVLGDDGKSWSVINDEKLTGLDVEPLGVAGDGKSGLLKSERADGTDAIERYEFATGKRTEVMRDPDSDPLNAIYDVDTSEPIGAWFDPTRPQARFWNSEHPQAKLQMELQQTFPGKIVLVTSTSRDGNLVVVAVASDRDPSSFYLVDRQKQQARLLAHSHPWLKPEALGATREIEVKARDGLVLHGLLTLPPGGGEKNLPMVVIPHGGPYWVNDGWGYDEEAILLASQGYAVLRVNFRGSAGYGKPFHLKGMRQWGKAMQDDVTDATKWAITNGFADPQRVCIYGGSYGAYAAMMGAIREPDLYKCAAGYAGVYDLGKLYKWDDIRRSELGLDFLHAAVGTDAAELTAGSPAKRAGEIKAKVFLAHGTNDTIADIRFAHEMEKALNKGAGKRVDLIEYPFQGHGLLIASQKEDFYTRLLAFFRENIGAAPAPQATASQ